MRHTIRNSDYSVSVTGTGIELCSFKCLNTETEYIWQADPTVWGSHAPVLFPIIGALKDGYFLFKGKKYSLPKHGIVRHSEKLRLLEKTDHSLLFSLKWDEESLLHYPFKFELLTRYILEENTLRVEHTVINHGSETMYFSLGGHPAFNCPLRDGESYSDHYLEFERPETAPTWLLNDQGLVSGETRPVFEHSNRLDLHEHLFDNDALIFKDLRSRSVSLVSRRSGKILTMDFEGFPFLGIWAKPGASFVCIEPWLGIADTHDTDQELTNKEGIVTLNEGKTFEASYSVTIHQK